MARTLVVRPMIQMRFLDIEQKSTDIGFEVGPHNHSPKSDIEPQSSQRIGGYGAESRPSPVSVFSVASVVNPISVLGHSGRVDSPGRRATIAIGIEDGRLALELPWRYSMHRLCLILTGVLLAAMVSAVTGCGGPGGQAQSGDMSVNLSGLPKTLRYPYAEAVSVETGNCDGAPAKVYSFTSNDPIPPVTEYYRAKFSDWKDYPVTTPTSGTASGFTSPDDKRTIVVTVASGTGGKTNLTIYNVTK